MPKINTRIQRSVSMLTHKHTHMHAHVHTCTHTQICMQAQLTSQTQLTSAFAAIKDFTTSLKPLRVAM